MLEGVRVLLVEDDDDTRELLGHALCLHGANVHASHNGELAVEEVSHWRPDVILADLALPGIDGATTLARIRERVHCPAIAVTGNATAGDRARSLAAGFAKHLTKPARVGDIIAAIDTVRVRAASDLQSELRSAVAKLNAQSGCRYTSILRFAENHTLVSIWTHDREAPDADAFPVGLPVAASYCVLIQRDGALCKIENAPLDVRVTDHPKRDELACYVGVPIWTGGGQLFGSLCSYDREPRLVSDEVLQLHQQVARELAPIFARLFDEQVEIGAVHAASPL